MTITDRAEWPAGPWDDEPDRDEWVDKTTGLPCIAQRGPVGAWCGYVGVDKTHSWHGVIYHQVAPGWTHSPETLVDVHGGLTYSDVCQPKIGICHTPTDGDDDRWWFGFDCAHAFDLAPGLLRILGDHGDRDVYRPLSYVRDQCAQLAAQLAAAAGEGL